MPATSAAPTSDRRLQTLVWFVGILLTFCVLWVLHVTMWLTMPLVAAFFIAVGVWPVLKRSRDALPRSLGWLGYVFAMVIVVLSLALFLLGIWYAALRVSAQWPKYREEFDALWTRIMTLLTTIESGGESASAAAPAAADNGNTVSLLDVAGGYILPFLGSFWNIVAIVVLIFFFVLLMLVEHRKWHDKLTSATADGNAATWLATIEEIGTGFRSYVFIRAVLGLATALLYGAWLWLWSVDFLVTWMLLAFLLSFVPTIGSLISGLLPVAFAFVQMSVGDAVLVGLGILAIEQVMGNWIDPLLQGRKLSISPLVILFSLLVWSWVWGIAGALLAVPITITIILVCAQIPTLDRVSLALSGESSLRDMRKRLS